MILPDSRFETISITDNIDCWYEFISSYPSDILDIIVPDKKHLNDLQFMLAPVALYNGESLLAESVKVDNYLDHLKDFRFIYVIYKSTDNQVIRGVRKKYE